MAWRWAGPRPRSKTSDTFVADWVHVPAEDSDTNVEYWAAPDSDAQDRRQGYCGLAGKPEFL